MEYTFYIIYCKDENIPDCYVGSTINLDNRKREHRKNCKYEKTKQRNYYVYQFIRENGGFDNWEFGILGIHSFDNRIDALIREQYYIESYDAKLNTKKAINIDSKELQIKKKYHNNKEKESLRKKKFYKENKENVFQRCKKYRENNKEKISLWYKRYYQENKEKILLKQNEYNLKKRTTLTLNDH